MTRRPINQSTGNQSTGNHRPSDRRKPGRTPGNPGKGSKGGNPGKGGKGSKGGKPFAKRQPPASGPAVCMRIAKAMARAGLCSRRDAERWIMDARVKVNGKMIASPALNVGPQDRIEIDGQALPRAAPVRLWRYHKPKGLVTSHKDPRGRPTVFAAMPPDLPRVVSIGRLDFNTEGLLLLTNDGALARHLELPATGWMRRYRVRAHVGARGRVTQDQLNEWKDGITVEGVRYGPIEAVLDSVQGANIWLSIGIREGKNREVRRVLATLDLTVNRLIRVSYGPFQLLDLKPGSVEIVRRKVMIGQFGARQAAALGITEDGDAATAKPARTDNKPAPAHNNKARTAAKKPRRRDKKDHTKRLQLVDKPTGKRSPDNTGRSKKKSLPTAPKAVLGG